MKSEKAINILNDLKEKLNAIDIHTCSAWQSQIKSYMVTFFGAESPEYDYAKSNNFWYSSLYTQETNLKTGKEGYLVFINGCIEIIQNRGIKKREWKHALVTTNPAIFWSVFTAILIFVFWLGGQLTVYRGNRDNKQIFGTKYDSIQKRN